MAKATSGQGSKTPAKRKTSTKSATAGAGKGAKETGAGKTKSTRSARATGTGTASKASAKQTRKPAAEKKQGRAAGLIGDLREWVSARLHGWGHDDWTSLLDQLRGRGHDTSDAAQIGSRLEQERLTAVLEKVAGMGPRRVEGLVARFGSVWNVRHASAEEVAAAPGMNRALADRVKAEVG